ncbi:MAG: radical SAM protein [Desulfobacterales bacterium]|nr:radical SAM protein [Deltaproteobacteria bacterium]NNK95780.1 radical SAM protein [Desulfobacterales bacterium]
MLGNGEKYNPALLRLELLSRGIRVDQDFTRQLGGVLKEPLWTRTGPTSTGIDLKLERGVYVSPAIEGDRFPYHYKDSPFLLTIDENALPVIMKDDRIVQYVTLFPRPSYYGKKTSNGTPMEQIGVVTGDFLAIAIDNRCWFWGYYQDDELVNYKEKQCKFCGIGLSMKRDELYRKDNDDIIEVLSAALEGNDIKHLGINAGTFPPPGRGHEEYARLISEIKARHDVWIRLSICPPEDERYIDILFDSGADQVGYDIEVFDPKLYKEICPGKNEEVDRGIPHQHFNRMLKYAAQKGGPNKTYSILVTGLESKESTVAGVEHLCQMGVVPRLGIFRPIPGTHLEKHPVPSPEYLIYCYRNLREITMEYGVDSGCAGCGRTFVGTKEYDGVNPIMPEISDEDLENAGIDPANVV